MTLSKKGYKDLAKLLKDLKEICSSIAVGGKELAKEVNEFKEGLKKDFLFIRLYIKKLFESGTGMGFDGWIEFGNELSKRFEDISNEVQKVFDFHSRSEFVGIQKSIEELEHVSNPFLNNYDPTIKTLDRLQEFLAEIPNMVKSVPSMVYSEEKKRTATKDSLEWVAELQTLVDALDEAKAKILDLKRFKK